ncbi:antibiotic biosynthesis monooxygenase [Saccharothrix stipae]
MTDVTHRLPDVARPDAGVVVINPVYAGSAERQREAAESVLAEWSSAPWPRGLPSLNVLTSLEGEALLAYSQWTDDADWHLADGVRYRVFRSLDDNKGREVPGCVITAGFDVDGPERQHHIVDALVDAVSGIEPFPGALSSHFHPSADGTRVLNYAEWTSPEAHARAMDNAKLDEIYRISLETPGVRPTRGRFYRLHGALRAD